MEAMVIGHYRGPEQLVLRQIPTPVPQDGEVLIKVRALDINRAETYMRRGEWPEIAPVSGIECVGEVEHDPSGHLASRELTTFMELRGGGEALVATFTHVEGIL